MIRDHDVHDGIEDLMRDEREIGSMTYDLVLGWVAWWSHGRWCIVNGLIMNNDNMF
jgi:hypothetical protein